MVTETAQPSEKTPEKSDGKSTEPAKSLLNEKSEEPKGAPTKYEDFKVPEGFTLDEDVKKDATALFKELDLNQGGSQKLVDFYVKNVQEAFQAPFNAWQDKQQEWRDAINSDPEIGGSRLNGVRASIGRLIDSFGNAKVAEGFRSAMDSTGAGNHPDVVRGLYALSKALTEGHAVRGNGPSPEGMRSNGQAQQPTTAQAMYPHLTSNR